MGQEIACRMQYQRRSLAGKAYLETDHILFRGDERVKIPLKGLQGVSAKGGVLTLEFASGPAELELGAAAEKWAQKILHPPTRADKLGVKPGLTVRLIGEFDAAFLEELRETHILKAKADRLFFLAADRKSFERIPKLITTLSPPSDL